MNESPHTQRRRLTFIVNPTAGHPWSLKRRRVHRILHQLPDRQAEVLWTQHPTQASAWAQARASDTGRVVVHVEPAWDDFPSADVSQDLGRFNAFLERHIRQAPSQYWWLHRRFKSHPDGSRRY